MVAGHCRGNMNVRSGRKDVDLSGCGRDRDVTTACEVGDAEPVFAFFAGGGMAAREEESGCSRWKREKRASVHVKSVMRTLGGTPPVVAHKSQRHA